MSECGACAGLLFAPFFHGREWSTTGRYLDTPENSEVCGDAGLAYHDEAGLAARIEEALEMSEDDRDRLRKKAAERAYERYNWEAVTTQYESLLLHLG